jgi:hypothetical protein
MPNQLECTSALSLEALTLGLVSSEPVQSETTEDDGTLPQIQPAEKNF